MTGSERGVILPLPQCQLGFLPNCTAQEWINERRSDQFIQRSPDTECVTYSAGRLKTFHSPCKMKWPEVTGVYVCQACWNMNRMTVQDIHATVPPSGSFVQGG